MKTHKIKVIGSSLFALTALVYTIEILSHEALAQTRPAITKNVDERGRQPYNLTVEFSQFGCQFNCSNFVALGSVLLFDAPPVPADKRLVVEWVSAELPANNNLNSISFQSSPILSNQRAKWQYHGPYFLISSTGGIWGMSSSAFFTYGPGESPHIRVKIDNKSTFITSISIGGYLIDAN